MNGLSPRPVPPMSSASSSSSHPDQAAGHALYVTGWALASHGQKVRVEVDGKQVQAAYAFQDNGLQIAGKASRVSAVLSTGFATCIGIAMTSKNHVGLAHISDVCQELPLDMANLYRDFYQSTGEYPKRVCLIRFDSSLRASLIDDQRGDPKGFMKEHADNISQGRKLISQRQALQLQAGSAVVQAPRPSAIDAIVESQRHLTQAVARRCGVQLVNLPGDSVLLDASCTLRSFPETPPFDPCKTTPSLMVHLRK